MTRSGLLRRCRLKCDCSNCQVHIALFEPCISSQGKQCKNRKAWKYLETQKYQEADRLASWLLEQDPSLTLQWLYEMLEGVRSQPEGFNWVGLAECAAYDTFGNTFHMSENASLPNLKWANVAVLAYHYAISQEKHNTRLAHKPEMKKLSYLSLEEALMNIQARCILAFGHVAGDPVLDGNLLLQCFFDDLPFSADEVRERYEGAEKELTPKEQREFIRIRKKIAVLQPLREKQVLPPSPELLAWFSVWDQLHFSHHGAITVVSGVPNNDEPSRR